MSITIMPMWLVVRGAISVGRVAIFILAAPDLFWTPRVVTIQPLLLNPHHQVAPVRRLPTEDGVLYQENRICGRQNPRGHRTR